MGGYWNKFWSLSWWWKAPSLLFASLLVTGTISAIAGAGSESKDATDSQAAATQTTAQATEVASRTVAPSEDDSATATPTSPPTATSTSAPTAAPTVAAIEYLITLRDDVSIGSCIRIVFRVRVSRPFGNEAELRNIAQEVIDDEISTNDVNAIGFFFLPAGHGHE